MQYRPVHWIEGMFLRPQHLQAADRYWSELIATSQRFDNPYHYGLRSIELSEEALGNSQVQVTNCKARLRDGSVVDIAAGQALDRVDLKPAFEHETEVMVYLAVPKLKLGRPNLGERYASTLLMVPDESRGANEQEIQFREMSLRILLSTDDMLGFETLPIARIRRTGSDDKPTLDENYFPPVLALEAWYPLQIGIVRNISDFVGRRIEVLSQRAIDRGLTFNSQEPGDLDDLLKLIALNQAYAVLGCLAFAEGVHPFPAYSELCRIVGMLAIFGEGRRTPEIPRYDHEDLARIFKWIEIRIKELAGAEATTPYEQRFFEGRESGMRVQIKSEWLHSDWNWFVGVNGRNIPEAQARELLQPGKLNWKMGSDSKVDLIFKYAMPDVEHVEVERPPRMLPAHRGWIYYKIVRDSENQAWKGVLAEETLSLRFSEDLIGNKHELPGKRQLEVVLPDKKAIMEFALFAVPPTSQK